MKSMYPTQNCDTIPGLRLRSDEQVVFCGQRRQWIDNPLDPRSKCRESAVLTDRRLVVLERRKFRPTSLSPTLVNVPLHKIDSVFTVDYGWTLLHVLVCMLLCLLYIVPGVVYFFHMWRQRGLWVVVVSGSSTTEIKFSRGCAEGVREFANLIHAYTDSSRSAEAKLCA